MTEPKHVSPVTPVREVAEHLPNDRKRLSNSLGVTAIVFMVVAAAAPLTVVGGIMPLGFSMGNGLGFPVMFLVAALILTLFSVGLSQMARVVPQPGAFYTYIRHGLGESPGAAAAFIAVVSYVCAPVCTSAYVGVQIDLAIRAIGGPAAPWWMYSAAVVALVAWLGYRNIDLTSRVLGVLLIGEVLVVVLLAAVIVATGGKAGLSTAPIEPSSVFSGNIGIAIMFAITGFIGFEATAVYRDEAKDPATTIPRATYISVIGVGIFYAIAGYALVVAWGPEAVIDESAADPAGMLVTTTHNYLGVAGEIAAQTLLITSVLAGYLAFHNVAARYMHSMAGHGMLRHGLGAVHARHRSPHRSSLVMTAMTGGVVAICGAIGLDPVTQIFAWFSTLATTGIMILMILTGAAVPAYFRRNAAPGNRWATMVAPLLGTGGLLFAGALLLDNFPMLVGGSPGLAYSLLAVFPTAAVIGVVVAARRSRTARSDTDLSPT
jgi:amino acid transporter